MIHLPLHYFSLLTAANSIRTACSSLEPRVVGNKQTDEKLNQVQ